MKSEILYISGTFKETNNFLSDVVKELSDRDIPILNFCRQKLILETEHAKLRCMPMNSHGLLAIRFSNVKYFIRGFGAYKTEFDKRIAFRLKPGTREIVGHQELLEMLSGERIDGHPRISYERIEKCLERRRDES